MSDKSNAFDVIRIDGKVVRLLGDASAYMPAHGYCFTCKYFTETQDAGLCHAYDASPETPFAFDHVLGVPKNGTGFCHNQQHKDGKEGTQ